MREFAASTASKPRIVLAWIIDLAIFLACFQFANFWFELSSNWNILFLTVIFIVFRLFFSRFNTPGMRAMSINCLTREVTHEIKICESFLTIFIGLIHILSGIAGLVQWTYNYSPIPWFGHEPGMLAQIALMILSSTLTTLAGYWYLKLRVAGIILAGSLSLFWIASIFFSMSWWREFFASLPHESLQAAAGGMGVEQLIEVLPYFYMGLYGLMVFLMLLTVPSFLNKINYSGRKKGS